MGDENKKQFNGWEWVDTQLQNLLHINVDELSVYDLGDQVGDYWDMAKPSKMTKPVMRAKDKYGRKGIIICLKSRVDPSIKMVFTYFERYSSHNEMVLCECHTHKWQHARDLYFEKTGYTPDNNFFINESNIFDMNHNPGTSYIGKVPTPIYYWLSGSDPVCELNEPYQADTTLINLNQP